MLEDEFMSGEEFFGSKVHFGNLLSQGEYAKALDVLERNNLQISPNNKYVSSVNDLALKAAFDSRDKEDYEGAYVTLLDHAPESKFLKDFARNFASDMLCRLSAAYDNFEAEGSVDLINELTYDLHYLQKSHFPEGLTFEKKSDVSLSSIVDSYRISKLFENYFVHVNSFNNTVEDLMIIEDYERINKLDEQFKSFDDAYSNFSFIGYVN